MSQSFEISKFAIQPDICECGYYCKLKTSKTQDNPGRRFLRCKVPEDMGGCKHFRWKYSIHVDKKVETKFKNPLFDKDTAISRISRDTVKLDSQFEEAFVWLMKLEVEKWTLYADGGRKWGMLTTNSSESFNGLLKSARGLLATTMVRLTFKQVMERFADRIRQARAILVEDGTLMLKPYKKMDHHRRKAEGHQMIEYDVVERVYEVRTGYYDGKKRNKHTVIERIKSCTCGKWKTYHMPCSHAVKCFERMARNATDYVAEEYKVVKYLRAYSGHFHPLGNQAYWPAAPFYIVANKNHIRKLRKNKLTRYHNQMDVSEKTYSRKCSTCKQFGHDKRSCRQNSPGGSTSGSRRVPRT